MKAVATLPKIGQVVEVTYPDGQSMNDIVGKVLVATVARVGTDDFGFRALGADWRFALDMIDAGGSFRVLGEDEWSTAPEGWGFCEDRRCPCWQPSASCEEWQDGLNRFGRCARCGVPKDQH